MIREREPGREVVGGGEVLEGRDEKCGVKR